MLIIENKESKLKYRKMKNKKLNSLLNTIKAFHNYLSLSKIKINRTKNQIRVSQKLILTVKLHLIQKLATNLKQIIK